MDILLFLLRRIHYRGHANTLRFLMVKMPRSDSELDKSTDQVQSMKQNIEIMNQLYKNFYAIYSKSFRDRMLGQPYISCELLVEKEIIKFLIAVPQDYIETYEKVISSFYPGAVIDEVPQPSLLEAGKHVAGGYFVLGKDNAYPIKTYENFEADPMDSILASYSRVEIEEKLCLQILVAPLGDDWASHMRKQVESIKNKKSFSLWNLFKNNDDKESDKPSHGLSSQQI
ncbi:MAG: hypothetical protein H6765_02240 [Candidatus Peribacteria bacterium]|nr:MAG: hypothetical protein H6765_02240 [Candidatus Peribacteria bacterium]